MILDFSQNSEKHFTFDLVDYLIEIVPNNSIF